MFQTRIVVRNSFEEEIRRVSQRKTREIKRVLLLDGVPGIDNSFHRLVQYFGEPELDKLGRIVAFKGKEETDRAEGSDGEGSDPLGW